MLVSVFCVICIVASWMSRLVVGGGLLVCLTRSLVVFMRVMMLLMLVNEGCGLSGENFLVLSMCIIWCRELSVMLEVFVVKFVVLVSVVGVAMRLVSLLCIISVDRWWVVMLCMFWVMRCCLLDMVWCWFAFCNVISLTCW